MDKYPFFILLKIRWKSLVRKSTIFYKMGITFHNMANVATINAKSHRSMEKKGGSGMACKHERIKSVNCVIFCEICGEKLPVDYLVGKTRIAEQKAVKTPEKCETAASDEMPEPATKKTTRRKKV